MCLLTKTIPSLTPDIEVETQESVASIADEQTAPEGSKWDCSYGGQIGRSLGRSSTATGETQGSKAEVGPAGEKGTRTDRRNLVFGQDGIGLRRAE